MRVHSPKQIAEIASSISAFGFNKPVLIDRASTIIAGPDRVEAAKKLGYVLADNKLAEKAGWDREILRIELQHLTKLDLDFDITITGFEIAEIDVLLGKTETKADSADVIPPLAEGPAVTRLGDVRQIGAHRLICSDATDLETSARLLDGERA